MSIEQAVFSLALQEQLLIGSLPEDGDERRRARRRISGALAAAVVQLVVHLKPSVVVEIGAHDADFSRQIKKQLPSSRVVAFEANPTVHQMYHEVNSRAGIEYLSACVAAESRSYRFKVPGRDTAQTMMGSMLKNRHGEVFATYDVDGVSLDTFLKDSGGRSAMWIDVEGAAGAVLNGADRSLKTCDLLFAELEAVERWEGQMLDAEVFTRLASVGLFPVLRDIQRQRWQHNVLFLRAEAMADDGVRRICADYLQGCLAQPTA